MAFSSRSVANTWSVGGWSIPSACSWSSMATEYASSPVAHAAIQTRTVSLGPLPRKRDGMTASRAANDSRSRKKFVTEMSMSCNSAPVSPGCVRRKPRYCGTSSMPLTCMRRAMRRRMVARL